MRCIFPGSFDPPTNGHIELIRRAAALYDEVVVAVLGNDSKKGLFTREERAVLLTKCTRTLPGVRVITDGGLLADVAKRAGADVILRGLRGEADVALESQMAALNKRLSGIESVFLFASPEYVPISSTIVREIAAHGGEVNGLVPEEILEDVRAKYR